MEHLAKIRDLCAGAGRLAGEGQAAAGLALAREAVDLARKGLGDGHYAYPMALSSLAWLEHDTGAAAEAEAHFAEVETLGRALASTDFEHARAALTHAADYHAARGDKRHAQMLLRELLDLHRHYLGPDHPRSFQAGSKLELGKI